MNFKNITVFILAIIFIMLTNSCRKNGCTNPDAINYNPSAKVDDGSCVCTAVDRPTPYQLEIPEIFKIYIDPPQIPADNPMTVEGVALGKRLFFDPKLSGDLTQSCSSCHMPAQAFDDNRRFSIGIDGFAGKRNAMPLFNLAWNSKRFFWDGRSNSLEEQVLEPVKDPLEMHDTWSNVEYKLQSDSAYPELFKSAFGTSTVDSLLVAKALAQYIRTLMSGNSKFDRHVLYRERLTPNELNGLEIFRRDPNSSLGGGACDHCHGDANNPLWTSFAFENNGLDASFTDLGLGAVTGFSADNGKFKAPSLRNLVFTAPYMHDGRFQTLDEVIDFYNDSLKSSPTTSPNLKNLSKGGMRLSPQEKADLKAFLLTLTDSSFIEGH